MPDNKDQERLMRWILFAVFMALFVLIVIGTLAALFFGFGTLQATERAILFNAFIVEIGSAVVALFYFVFRLKPKDMGESPKVRFNISETSQQRADVRQLIGKTAILTFSKADGAVVKDDLKCTILDDGGPYIPLNLPPLTHDVFVTVKIGNETYSGAFVVGTHLVGLGKSEA